MYLFNVSGGKTSDDCIVTANGEAWGADGESCEVIFNIDIKKGDSLKDVLMNLKSERLKNELAGAVDLLKLNGYTLVKDGKVL